MAPSAVAAHNAISGFDDDSTLREIVKMIDDVDDMIESFVGKEIMEEPLEQYDKMLSPAVQFDFKNVTFTFLPHQVNDMATRAFFFRSYFASRLPCLRFGRITSAAAPASASTPAAAYSHSWNPSPDFAPVCAGVSGVVGVSGASGVSGVSGSVGVTGPAFLSVFVMTSVPSSATE